MADLLERDNFFLVGIKGVGMTALASCLLDAGKQVSGSDVSEHFPTQANLERLGVEIVDLAAAVPAATQVVIYSGANGGRQQPQVQAALARGLPVLTHAAALGELFNTQKGVAVCGVGGKSTISAMLAVITQRWRPQSYAVGVGEILGLTKTGQYLPASEYFIAEADEYIEDPTLVGTADVHFRFQYLRPWLIICPNLRFDHPDVYRDLAHTQEVFGQFFATARPGGKLIYHGGDENLQPVVEKLRGQRPDMTILSYGESADDDYQLTDLAVGLAVPGQFNRLNALAALAGAEQMGLDRAAILAALTTYRSVRRRLELVGEPKGVVIWDDYAHHPSEIRAAIAALRERYPTRRLVVAFQPHTYSRTKALFDDFAAALATAPEVWLTDIFASARESADPSVSSAMLATAIADQYPTCRVRYVGDLTGLKTNINQDLHAGEVLLILGAGDIYHVVRAD